MELVPPSLATLDTLSNFSSRLFAVQFASPGPIVFSAGPITVRWYGLLIASAVLIGVSLSQFLAQRRQVSPELIGDLVVWLVLGALPGARLYYVLFQWSEYANRPEDIIAIWKGGIAIHGAILGGAIAVYLFARRHKVSFWTLADIVAPSLILGQAIGRWGNFFNSEAFGAPTDLPWKLFIPVMNRPLNYRGFDYFHPTFLYESIWNLLIFALLMVLFLRGWRGRSPLKAGTIFLIYLASYSTGRVWIEELRTDSLMFGSLKMAQIFSLCAIALALLGLGWLYLRDRRLPDVVTPSFPTASDQYRALK